MIIGQGQTWFYNIIMLLYPLDAIRTWQSWSLDPIYYYSHHVFQLPLSTYTFDNFMLFTASVKRSGHRLIVQYSDAINESALERVLVPQASNEISSICLPRCAIACTACREER
jgi:hypothetical protein